MPNLGPEHHVIADLAARLAKAERALEEAEKVIKPFAESADDYGQAWDGGFEFKDVGFGAPNLNIGHLRAARKWMESRHD